MLQDEATILNSKRFPVNANGDVRLRSVGSLSTAGHSFTPRSSIPAGIDESAYPFSIIWSTTPPIWSPKKIEIIAGGASCAPRRWSFPGLEAAVRRRSACRLTAFITQPTINWKRISVSGDLPGLNRLMPSSVERDQLLCFPEPFIPANGFSWSKHTRPWRVATFFKVSISKRLLSAATFVTEKIGATSCCPGATSLCCVFAVIPNLHNSSFSSFIKEPTRSGITPKYWSSSSCPFGAGAPNKVRPVNTRSSLCKYLSLSTMKYSCSGPTHAITFVEVVFPIRRRSLTPCSLTASMERSNGVLASSASPVYEQNAAGIQRIVPIASSFT